MSFSKKEKEKPNLNKHFHTDYKEGHAGEMYTKLNNAIQSGFPSVRTWYGQSVSGPYEA
jgi:hypothetical protein